MAGKLAVDVRSDLRRPLRRVFKLSSRTIDFTPRFEKNNHVITSLWTARLAKIGNAQLSMNEFLPAVTFLALNNTFPEFFLKFMFTTSIGRPFISGTALFESVYDDCELRFIHRIFKFTDLGSACGHRICDRVIIFVKRME